MVGKKQRGLGRRPRRFTGDAPRSAARRDAASPRGRNEENPEGNEAAGERHECNSIQSGVYVNRLRSVRSCLPAVNTKGTGRARHYREERDRDRDRDEREELFLPALRLRVAAAFRAEAERADFGREAEAFPPFRPPLRAGAVEVRFPRPDPLFFPPPDILFSVAQARRSASFRDTPRFS
jgi:hypothetical protein